MCIHKPSHLGILIEMTAGRRKRWKIYICSWSRLGFTRTIRCAITRYISKKDNSKLNLSIRQRQIRRRDFAGDDGFNDLSFTLIDEYSVHGFPHTRYLSIKDPSLMINCHIVRGNCLRTLRIEKVFCFILFSVIVVLSGPLGHGSIIIAR